MYKRQPLQPHQKSEQNHSDKSLVFLFLFLFLIADTWTQGRNLENIFFLNHNIKNKTVLKSEWFLLRLLRCINNKKKKKKKKVR